MLIPFSVSAAEEDSSANSAIMGNPLATQAAESEERHRRLGALSSYIRGQIPDWMPAGFGNLFRSPGHWLGDGVSNQMDISADGHSSSGLSSLIAADAELVKAPSSDASALWLDPGYHHKGFLPMHDAMLMGINLRPGIGKEYLQMNIHPFYGQNWHSTDSYYGAETALDLRADAMSSPWGEIALRFNSGHTDMMDQGRGVDMHTELNFDERSSFSAGRHENEASASDNYLMLRWKIGLPF